MAQNSGLNPEEIKVVNELQSAGIDLRSITMVVAMSRALAHPMRRTAEIYLRTHNDMIVSNQSHGGS